MRLPKIASLDLRPTRQRSALYAAAKTSRLTGEWSPTDAGVNEIIVASAPMVRRRVRQMVQDFPYFARAVNVLTDYVVGDGIVFQSRAPLCQDSCRMNFNPL